MFSSSTADATHYEMGARKQSRLSSWKWYAEGTPKEEKELLRKLDCMILVFGCLTFFTKVIKRNISNKLMATNHTLTVS